MDDDLAGKASVGETSFAREIARKTARKIKAQRDGPQGIWFGLGMSGLIGWSVAVPTLIGAFLGLWLDHHHPGGHSWTLALLVAGLTLGCFNAWYWLAQQERDMNHESQDKDE